jgi:hypothetical protein
VIFIFFDQRVLLRHRMALRTRDKNFEKVCNVHEINGASGIEHALRSMIVTSTPFLSLNIKQRKRSDAAVILRVAPCA